MGCFPKPIHTNMTASIRAYPGLLCEEDVRVFVATSRQLCSGLNKVKGKAETFAFLGALLLTVEKLKTSCLNTLYDLNVRLTLKMLARKLFSMHVSRCNSPLVACTQL